MERGTLNDTLLASCAILTHPPFGRLPTKGIEIVQEKELVHREEKVYESLSLGGRTRINAGLYLPGCPAEYENWGEGWQWEDVAPFFRLSEDRLESKRPRTEASTTLEGGEWKTRVIKAEYESSRQ